jgi:hypothetical protein
MKSGIGSFERNTRDDPRHAAELEGLLNAYVFLRVEEGSVTVFFGRARSST